MLVAAADDLNAQPSRSSTGVTKTGSTQTRATPTHSITGHIIFQSIVSTSASESASSATTSATDAAAPSSLAQEGSSPSTSPPPPPLEAHAQEELKAECSAAGVENWDRNLQIGGVFIILFVGGLGAMLPIACRYVRWLNVSSRVLTTGKFFGAGVILATAFVHMLSGATETLKDECLEGRMGDFDAWPGFLAMLAILAMHLMEHLLTMHFVHNGATNEGTRVASPGDATPLDIEEAGSEKHSAGHVHMLLDTDQRRKQLSTYILELGIALHSVIVGMTLAVTGGTGFKTLLAAISFHQFFEGVALGTRISELRFARRPFLTGLLNACVFALTTPLGQVIGIAIRQSFAPRSPNALLTMGVLDSLSAGILIYSAVVNLLVEEFASLEFRSLGRKSRILYFGAMYAGCAAMSVIGRWA
ncbi:hypothetical protein LPJ53_002040 [Coemansia erecta]|uniref:Zinc/iron permease n=1 Tax=Coemansia erecta TaxID=147472 RepID=A0A9W8CUA1_9FUNG|nr:hypothetical protein LPJ53_002040 [Coemansia erecta]